MRKRPRPTPGPSACPPAGPPLGSTKGERRPPYTAVPNVYFDHYLPRLRPLSAVLVLQVIMRHTLGYGRQTVLLTLDTLCDLTGLHREEVERGLKVVGNWTAGGLGLVWRKRATLADLSAGSSCGFGYIYGLVAAAQEQEAGVDSRVSRTNDSRDFRTDDGRSFRTVGGGDSRGFRTNDSRDFRTDDGRDSRTIGDHASPGPEPDSAVSKERVKKEREISSSSISSTDEPADRHPREEEDYEFGQLQTVWAELGLPATMPASLARVYGARLVMLALAHAVEKRVIHRPAAVRSYLLTVLDDWTTRRLEHGRTYAQTVRAAPYDSILATLDTAMSNYAQSPDCTLPPNVRKSYQR